jgi:hypothetical protein
MQIMLRRDDEHMVGSEDQSFRNQLDRHCGVARQNLVELGGDDSQVINDDDRHTHFGRQVLQQAGIGVEPTRRTAHANDRKVLGVRHRRQVSPPATIAPKAAAAEEHEKDDDKKNELHDFLQNICGLIPP